MVVVKNETFACLAHILHVEQSLVLAQPIPRVASPTGAVDWATAYERYADDVYRLARVIVRDPDDASEVLQSTFEKAYKHRDRFDDRRPLRAWLMGIASHEALWLARRRRMRLWQPLLGRETARQTAEGSSAVWQAVNSLPAPHRACVGLFYLHGYSIDEIAEMLHVPAGTVGSRLHNARQRLKQLLQETRKEDGA